MEKYEPLPRWGHASIIAGDKLYMWGGRTEDFSDHTKEKVRIYGSQLSLRQCNLEIGTGT